MTINITTKEALVAVTAMRQRDEARKIWAEITEKRMMTWADGRPYLMLSEEACAALSRALGLQ